MGVTRASAPYVRTSDANFDALAEFPYEPHYISIDGLRMHYVDEGRRDGPVALMVHGMPTWSYLYRHIIPILVEAGYRCVAPDHIGFGRSDKVTDPAWYDIARHTANLAYLVQQLDLHNITLMAQD
jgi:haloalkane dehalogenase